LSLTNLGKIEVPLPPLNIQQEFNSLQTKITELKAKHAKIREANQALIPATLEQIFQ
jgi:restriction endonuclease S subunit